MKNETTLTCPHCKKDLIAVGKFKICPEHGTIEAAEKRISLRVFLSYGHDDNRPLVDMIKGSLEERGHLVWLDDEQIKEGNEWRTSITQGIQKRDSVLAFLSKHSVRQPGVCRDEIGIALGCKTGFVKTLLVENEQEVKPPSSVSHIQWLDLQTWRENIDNSNWKVKTIDSIVAVIESRENIGFSGDISYLDKILSPKGGSLLHALLNQTFVGRRDIISAIERWRIATPSRLCWIKGGPGTGKSALSAYLAHYGKSVVIATHFCDWGNSEQRSPMQLICNIAFQLAARLPDYRSLLVHKQNIEEIVRSNDANVLFEELLTNLLNYKIDGQQEHYIILVDALDEASSDGINAIADMLKHNANRLPKWVKILITSRPEIEVETPLDNLENITTIDLDTLNNYQDIEEYLCKQLLDLPGFSKNKSSIIEKIYNKSEGVFLYVKSVTDEILNGNYAINSLDELPQGLNDFYHNSIKRRFPDLNIYKTNTRRALSLIAVAHEPIKLSLVAQLMEWDDLGLMDFETSLGALLIKEEGCLIPFHKSLFDWLQSPKAGAYRISKAYGNQRIIDYAWEQFIDSSSLTDDYFKHTLVLHLLDMQEWNKLHSLLKQEDILSSFTQQIFIDHHYFLLNKADALSKRRIFYFIQEYFLTIAVPSDDVILSVLTTLLKCSCLQIGKELISELNKCQNVSHNLKGNMLLISADSALETTSPKEAVSLYKEVLSQEQKYSDKVRCKAYHGLALVYHNYGNYSEEYHYLNKALSIYQENNDEMGISKVYHQLGSVFSRQGELLKAKEYYDMSLAISEKMAIKTNELLTKHELAGIDSSLGNYVAAIEKLDDEQAYVGVCLGYRSCGSILYEKGKVLALQGKATEAIEVLLESLSVFKAINDARGMALAYGELGKIYVSNGNTEAGRIALEDSIRISQEINYQRGFMYSSLNLIKLELTDQNLMVIKNKIDLLAQEIPAYDDLQFKYHWVLLLGDYEFYSKNFAKAADLYQTAIGQSKTILFKRGVADATLALAKVQVENEESKTAENTISEVVLLYKELQVEGMDEAINDLYLKCKE